MPLTVGGRRPGPSADQLLDWLASLWVEATELGKEVRALEAKIARQTDWLDANRDHELYGKRSMQAWDVHKEHERLMRKLHGLASDANRLTDKMDRDTKRRATAEIHEWAAIGSPGVYAIAWDLVPDGAWLEAAQESQR